VALALNGKSVKQCYGDLSCSGFTTCFGNVNLGPYITSDGRVTVSADASAAVAATTECPVAVKAIIQDSKGVTLARKTRRCTSTGCSLSYAFAGLPCV
jgi:hypothetical protein